MGCKNIMDMLQGKHFSITDPKGVNTVIYQVNKTAKEFQKDYPKYTVERLDFTEEIEVNSLIMKLLAKLYLKSQQKRYMRDLENELNR